MKEETEFLHDWYYDGRGSFDPPVYFAGGFRMPEGEKYRYGREKNPTVEYLEEKVARLEGGEMGNCFSSGMSAITTSLLSTLDHGYQIVTTDGIFARTFRFFKEILPSMGYVVKICAPNEDQIEKAVNSKKSIIFVESLTNPLLYTINIKKLREIKESSNSLLFVDNTILTPANIKPLKLGADLVIHSASKFLSGHNNVIGGLVTGKRDVVEKIDALRRTMGTSMDPMSAYLILIGLKTFHLRMDKINQSAKKIHEFLLQWNQCEKVYFPDSGGYTKDEFKGPSGVISFVLNKKVIVNEMQKKLKIINFANTLGSLNSLISHPYTMSHRSLSTEEKKISGIDENLLRLSVGIEDPEDLIEDLQRLI
ncbi:PLP-dependent transferase [Caldiplasma sukawensis]